MVLKVFLIFFYLSFLSRTFTNHRIAGEKGGNKDANTQFVVFKYEIYYEAKTVAMT